MFRATEEAEKDGGPTLLLQHIPSLLRLSAETEETTGEAIGGDRGLLSADTGWVHQAAGTSVGAPLDVCPAVSTQSKLSPPPALSLALRVLLPALYHRQLGAQELAALLQPLTCYPHLATYVAEARDTAPQSSLALLPEAIKHIIELPPEVLRDGTQCVHPNPSPARKRHSRASHTLPPLSSSLISGNSLLVLPFRRILLSPVWGEPGCLLSSLLGCLLRHISPLLRLVTVLRIDPTVYVPPLLWALQHASLNSLHWTVSRECLPGVVCFLVYKHLYGQAHPSLPSSSHETKGRDPGTTACCRGDREALCPVPHLSLLNALCPIHRVGSYKHLHGAARSSRAASAHGPPSYLLVRLKMCASAEAATAAAVFSAAATSSASAAAASLYTACPFAPAHRQSGPPHLLLPARCACRLCSNLVASPVLPSYAAVSLVAGLRCSSSMGVASPELAALACTLLHQWQRRKYGRQDEGTDERHEQQHILEGGLPDEVEVAILHCLLSGEYFSDL